jgi:hypothetical protein
MRIVIAAALVAGFACTADAPGSGTTTCTMALYDPCFDEHNCFSGTCQGFDDVGPACTMACTQGGAACPDDDGMPVPCDSDNVCHPPKARDCTIVP